MKKRLLAWLTALCMAIGLLPGLGITASAADGDGTSAFKIELGDAVWVDPVSGDPTQFTYPDAKFTSDSDQEGFYILNVTITDGQMDTSGVSKPTLEDLTGKSATWIFDSPQSAAAIAEMLKALKFTYAKDMHVSVTIDGNKVEGFDSGTGDMNLTYWEQNGHYYLYVKEMTSWSKAYNKSKSFTLGGRKGYLATISSDAELNHVLSVSDQPTWMGATSLLLYGSGAKINDAPSIAQSATSLQYPSNISSILNQTAQVKAAMYWACGPESGKTLNLETSMTWASSEPNASNQPNTGKLDTTLSNVANIETCGMVITRQSPAHSNIGFNDIFEGNYLPQSQGGIVNADYFVAQGYFVEFGGYAENADPGGRDSSKEVSVSVVPAPRYSHAKINVTTTGDEGTSTVYIQDAFGKTYLPDGSGVISNVPRNAGELTIFVIPSQGDSETFYALSKLEVDNSEVSTSYTWGQDNKIVYSYKFEPTKEEHTVSADFSKAHVVHVHVSGGTAFFPDGEPNNQPDTGNTNYRVVVQDGERLKVELTKQSTAADTFNAAVWNDGTSEPLTNSGGSSYEYTIQSVDKPGTLNVHFVDGETVMVQVVNGTFEKSPQQEQWWCTQFGHDHLIIPSTELSGVNLDLDLTFVPNPNHALKGITLDNTPQDVSQLLADGTLTEKDDGSYVLGLGEPGSHNRTVYVQFAPLHTVTFTTDSSSVSVMDGDTIPEKAFPEVSEEQDGRTFFGWKDQDSGKYYDKNSPVKNDLKLSPDYKSHVVTQPDGGPPVIGGDDFIVHVSGLQTLTEESVKGLAKVSAMDATGGQIDSGRIDVYGLEALKAGVADGRYFLVFAIGETRVTVTATVTGANPEITGRTAHTLTFQGEPNQTYTISKLNSSGTPYTSTARTDANGRGVFTGLEKATQYEISHTLYGKTQGWTSLVNAEDIAKKFASDGMTTEHNGKTDQSEQAENGNVIVTVGPDGNYLVTLKQDIGHTVEIPDIWGTVNVELNGHNIKGSDATETDEAQPGLLFTKDDTITIPSGMDRPGTGLNIADQTGKGEVKGGDGYSPGNPDGAPGIDTDEASTPDDIVLTVGSGATVIGGDGANGTETSLDGGSGGSGIRGGVEVAVDGGMVIGGSGGDGANGTETSPDGGSGGSGGDGIDTSKDVTVTGGTVTGGTGGDGGSATDGKGGSGGNGGGGVTVTAPGAVTVGPGSVTGGNGGSGGKSEEGNGGIGGDGGDGIDGDTTVKTDGTVTGGDPGNGGKPGQGTTDPDPDSSGTITDGSDVSYGKLSSTTTTVTVTGPKVGAVYTIYHSDGATPVAGAASQTGQTGKNITFTGLTPDTQYVVKADGWSGTIRTGGGDNGSDSGSGSDAVTYAVKVESSGDGTAKADKVKSSSGAKVTITTRGEVESISATADRTGKAVALTDAGGGRYTFTMPTSAVTVTVVFAQEELPSVADPDYTGVSDWLNTARHMVYMRGYDAGTFGPGRSITRAEVTQVFYNLMLDKSHGQDVHFSDVDADAWYYEAVTTLANKGILAGYEDGTFRPEQAITRAEFTTIASRFAKASTQKEVAFPDVPADAWYYGSVQTAVSYGWINGYEDGTFRPVQTITRAETAAIVNRMMARIPDHQAVDNGAGTRFPDVSASHWAFYDIVEASTDHDYTRTSNTGQETWR